MGLLTIPFYNELMSFAFFGTPGFAATILKKMIEAGLVPEVLICNPDRPVGRKKIVTPPPTKILAGKHNIPVWQPEDLNVGEFQNKLKGLDLAVLAAYTKIIPKEIISIPKSGTIVVHPSLLPRFRGATPIQSAILAGDKVTGTTLILADEKVDHGPIIAGEPLEIGEKDNYETLIRKLAELSGELLIKTIPLWLEGKINTQIQNETYATYTKKFTSEDAFVDLEKDDPVLIERKVRALNPEPGTWTKITSENYSLIRANKGVIGKKVKILDAEIKNGTIVLKKIQIEGKKPFNVTQDKPQNL